MFYPSSPNLIQRTQFPWSSLLESHITHTLDHMYMFTKYNRHFLYRMFGSNREGNWLISWCLAQYWQYFSQITAWKGADQARLFDQTQHQSKMNGGNSFYPNSCTCSYYNINTCTSLIDFQNTSKVLRAIMACIYVNLPV